MTNKELLIKASQKLYEGYALIGEVTDDPDYKPQTMRPSLDASWHAYVLVRKLLGDEVK